MVLTELLNEFGGHGEQLRRCGLQFVERLRSGTEAKHPGVAIIPQTHYQFVAACAVYDQRHDKGWSLTDCASYLAMKAGGITDALTHDRHFEQMGFRALLRTDA